MEGQPERGGMDSRSIPGDGIAHEENWIEERLIDASSTDEYAAAAEQLKQEVQDLRNLTGGGSNAGAAPSQSGNAVMSDRASVTPSDTLDPGRGSVMDPEQQPPEAEARATVTSHLPDGSGTTSR